MTTVQIAKSVLELLDAGKKWCFYPIRRKIVNENVLVIDESKWLHGNGAGVLLDNSGKMCCLGFECIRRGIDPDMMCWQKMPNNLRYLNIKVPGKTPKEVLDGLIDSRNCSSDFAKIAAEVNDFVIGVGVGNKLTLSSSEAILNEIIPNYIIETEEDRRRIITKLFKHFINVEVQFVNG